MSEIKKNIVQQIRTFEQNEDNYWLFFDWFCNNKSLESKALKLIKKVEQIVFSPKFDCETSYIWFKNNCPGSCPLYDDFRISDIKTGNVVYTVCEPSYDEKNWAVWGRENDFEEVLFSGTWREVKAFFMGAK